MFKYLFIFFFFFSLSLKAKDLVIVDIDFLIQNSKLGKNIIKNLDTQNKKINEVFLVKENDFKTKEKTLISKKNILDEDEFGKEVEIFKKEIDDYNIDKEKKLKDFAALRNKKLNELYTKINEILLKYSEENNIITVIDKKYILLSKTENDITSEILNLLNK
jgi:Skp family chaperone for outer membrane proteins